MGNAMISRLGATREYVNYWINKKILSATSSNMDIYVSESGGDTYEGTQSRPYKTIKKALSRVPKVINHAVNIHIGDGTFPPTSTPIWGFSGSGILSIMGNDTSLETKTKISGSLHVTKMSVNKIQIQNITFEFTGATGSTSEITSIFVLNRCTFRGTPDSPVASGFDISRVNNCVMEYCSVQHATNGVRVMKNSNARIESLTAENVSNAVSVLGGSMVIMKNSIKGVNTIYKESNYGACVIYPNGTFNPD